MKEFREVLDPIIIKIIEDWGLMMVDRVAEPRSVFQDDQPFYLTTIHFVGPVEGHYRILCQEGYAATLTENLLASGDTSEADRIDALKEMANICAGNLLTESYGAEAVFDLGIGEVRTIPTEEAGSILNDPRTFCYAADGEAVAVTFEMLT